MGRKQGGIALFKKPRSEVFWCRFSVNGKQYKLTTGKRDHDEAATEAEKIRAEIVLTVRPPIKIKLPKDNGHTLLQLSTRFIAYMHAQAKSPLYIKSVEKHFRAHILTRWSKLYELTTANLARYPVMRTQDKPAAGPVTIYKEQVTLSRFLVWAKAEGLLDTLPEIQYVARHTDYQPPDLTPEHVAALLSELPNEKSHSKHRPVREFYSFVWAQALRSGEAVTLRWKNVDLVKGTITIAAMHDKGRRGRTLPLDPLAQEILVARSTKPHKPEDLVFGKGNFRRSLELAAERAKLPHVTPHHLRHARISELASVSKDVGAIQYFAGHASLATTSIYVRSRTAQAAEMLRDLNSKKAKSA